MVSKSPGKKWCVPTDLACRCEKFKQRLICISVCLLQPMLPTYVFGWPTGNEKGSYLAVDLGGTNLRVCHVELEGEGRFEVTQTKFRLYVLQTRIDRGSF